MNLVIVGSAGAGKSSLMKRIGDAKARIVDKSDSNGSSFWTRQFEGDDMSTDVNTNEGVQYNVTLGEVRGSRGRSSNYRALLKQFETAEGVIVATRASNASPKTFQNELSYYGRIIRQARVQAARKAQGDTKLEKELTPEQQAALEASIVMPPVSIWVTQADKQKDNEDDDGENEDNEETEKKIDAPVFRTSAVTGENVTEAFSAIVQQVHDHKMEIAATKSDAKVETNDFAEEVALIDKLTAAPTTTKLQLPQIVSVTDVAVAL